MKESCLALCLISALLNFCKCGQPEHKDEDRIQNNSSKDVPEKKYSPIDMDTIETEIKLSMYNELYNLKIKKYCLNDSAIANKLSTPIDRAERTKKVLNISHNYSVQIILMKDNKVVISKQVDKEIFKDSLNSKFYSAGVLKTVQYDFVRTNRLYFKATITIPQTDQNDELQFAIFYQTNKIGQLDFWRVKGFSKNN
jgi:hypothetical protein